MVSIIIRYFYAYDTATSYGEETEFPLVYV